MSKVNLTIADDGIATVVLNDPSHRNAMGLAMASDFRTVVDQLADQQNLAAVILTGAGSTFAAGGDLAMLKQKSQQDQTTNRHEMLAFYDSFLCIDRLSVPLIAAVNGHAIGAGLCLALACDFRIVATNAKLSLNFVRIGLHPGMGATYFLPRLVGFSAATDILATGRLVTGTEAVSIGLAHQCVNAEKVLPRACELAQTLLQSGSDAVQGTLRTLRPDRDALNAALEREASEQSRNYLDPEFGRRIDELLDRTSR